MGLQNDLLELLQAGVISEDTEKRIRGYYDQKKSGGTSRLNIIFGVLGATLVGLGIILIVAHNWDDLSRGIKTSLSFIPLLIGQLACAYALFKKRSNHGWAEGASVFLFFAIGASISLISQVYHIPGNINVFILTWMLLALPMVYLLKSSTVSIFYIVGITYYAFSTGYSSYSLYSPHWYWLLFALILPHYIYLFKNRSESNYLTVHHFFIPISLLIALPILVVRTDHDETFIIPAYLGMLSIYYHIGHASWFQPKRSRINFYQTIGSVGTIGILLAFTFDDFWHELIRSDQLWPSISTISFTMTAVFGVIAAILLTQQYKGYSWRDFKPISLIFFLFMPIFILGFYLPYAVFLINILVFAIGIMTIREGVNRDNLGILNYGLLIITVLITCRFFDTNLSFVWRGILFLSLGFGFFFTNSWLLKRRKQHQTK